MVNGWKLNTGGSALLGKAVEIAEEVVRPAAQITDREGRFPEKAIGALRAAGLLGLVGSGEVGGKGQGLRAAVAIAERLARECPSTAMVVIMHFAASAVIEKHGSLELRRSVAEGGKLATLAFSEYGSRSHFWLPVSTAERKPEGIHLNAEKQLVTSAGNCNIYVWSSKPAAAEGLSTLWAVPADAGGLTIPDPFDGLGLRGNSSAPITARDVVIPESHRLGEDGKGFDVMMETVMPYFSLQNCAVSLGMMEGVLERVVNHVKNSRYSYDGSRISDFPQVRNHMARMRIKIDLVRAFLQDSLDAVEGARDDAVLRVLEAKVVGAETSLEVHDLAMRVCGGAAFRKDLAVERYFRDSRAATVMAPVSDALYDFVGKAVCGMPVFG